MRNETKKNETKDLENALDLIYYVFMWFICAVMKVSFKVITGSSPLVLGCFTIYYSIKVGITLAGLFTSVNE